MCPRNPCWSRWPQEAANRDISVMCCNGGCLVHGKKTKTLGLSFGSARLTSPISAAMRCEQKIKTLLFIDFGISISVWMRFGIWHFKETSNNMHSKLYWIRAKYIKPVLTDFSFGGGAGDFREPKQAANRTLTFQYSKKLPFYTSSWYRATSAFIWGHSSGNSRTIHAAFSSVFGLH